MTNEMTAEEAIRKVKGYLTDYLPRDCADEIDEIINALKSHPTDAKKTIIKSALKYLVKMQIDQGGVGFAVDNDPDHDCCWDDVLAWIEAQPTEMRDATEEERKSVKDYVESISKPTGIRFEDLISREELIKQAFSVYYPLNGEN